MKGLTDSKKLLSSCQLLLIIFIMLQEKNVSSKQSTLHNPTPGLCLSEWAVSDSQGSLFCMLSLGTAHSLLLLLFLIIFLLYEQSDRTGEALNEIPVLACQIKINCSLHTCIPKYLLLGHKHLISTKQMYA